MTIWHLEGEAISPISLQLTLSKTSIPAAWWQESLPNVSNATMNLKSSMVLKSMHWIPRYWTKCVKIWKFGLLSKIPPHLYKYLGIRCLFFKTDFCFETVSLSQSFWVPWIPKTEQFFFSYNGLILSLRYPLNMSDSSETSQTYFCISCTVKITITHYKKAIF